MRMIFSIVFLNREYLSKSEFIPNNVNDTYFHEYVFDNLLYPFSIKNVSNWICLGGHGLALCVISYFSCCDKILNEWHICVGLGCSPLFREWSVTDFSCRAFMRRNDLLNIRESFQYFNAIWLTVIIINTDCLSLQIEW